MFLFNQSTTDHFSYFMILRSPKICGFRFFVVPLHRFSKARTNAPTSTQRAHPLGVPDTTDVVVGRSGGLERFNESVIQSVRESAEREDGAKAVLRRY